MLNVIVFVLLLLVGAGMLIVGKVDEGSSAEVNLRPYSAIPFALALIVVFLGTVRTITPGEVAIPVTFGNVGTPRSDSPTIVNHFAEMKSFDVKEQTFTISGDGTGEDVQDPSVGVNGRDGATGGVDATLTYQVVESEAGNLYENVGTNYVDKLIRPTTRSCIRDVFATETMVEAATTARERVSSSTRECIAERLESNGINVVAFQLRDVRVSQQVQEAIDAKVKAEQDVARRNLELQSEAAEAEKKRIEAKGIADSEQIIKCGATVEVITNDDGTTSEVAVPKEGDACEQNLTPEYLTFQYIQALEEMARNGNSTVVVPSDSSLTPILPLP